MWLNCHYFGKIANIKTNLLVDGSNRHYEVRTINKETNMSKLKKAAIAAALATALAGSSANAGPLSGLFGAKLTAEICAPLTVAAGPFGLACFVGGGALSIIAGLAPVTP